jgi:hypothetical protein
VWHKNIPSKVSLFVWRLLRNRLPTKDNLARRNILHSNDQLACVADCGDAETAQHIFLSCAISVNVWQHVRSWLGIDFVAPNMLDIILLSFLIWRVCRDLHIFSLQLSGLPVFGSYGKKGITVSSET